ncbi:hypothetical protein [Flavobacterium sp.]|uniref:hypothetical protein n=1 Tax=Flavobacterium sp. TaxID=239 RepID=UPI00334181EC
MEQNNFRNFNVCGKATASQKEIYRKKAEEAGLSLSEWTISRLDLYLEQEMLKEKKNKQRFLKQEDHPIPVKYTRGEIQNQSKLVTKKITPNSNETNVALQKEIQQLKSVSSSFNQLGVIALIGAILVGK